MYMYMYVYVYMYIYIYICVCTTIGFDQPKKGHDQPNGIQLLTKSEDLTILFHQPYWGSTEHGISLPKKMRWDSKKIAGTGNGNGQL